MNDLPSGNIVEGPGYLPRPPFNGREPTDAPVSKNVVGLDSEAWDNLSNVCPEITVNGSTRLPGPGHLSADRAPTEAKGTGSAVLLRLVPVFDLIRDGIAVALPSRAQRLVALLAISDRPLSRSIAAARLWPDVINARANASLRATLWSFPHDTPSPVVVEGNMLLLDPSIRLDLDEAYQLANSVVEGNYTCDGGFNESHLRDDLLPTWPDEWLVIDRERFRQLRLHALDELCLLHGRAGRYARAIEAGLASVLSEPTRESAHRALMTAHLLEGNRMEAIRQYHAYLAVARAEMGIGPSDRLQRLFRIVLDDAADDDPMTLR